MILTNGRIYIKGQLHRGSLLIHKGIIKSINFNISNHKINELKTQNTDGIVIDCQDKIILPGIIDIHSHLRDLGQKDKETFKTGTMAAAFSGITTAFNMPNTIPPAINAKLIKKWMNKASKNIFIDVGFISGVPKAINENEIKKIIDLGVIGFKIYPLEPLNYIDWKDPSKIQKIIHISAKYQIPIFIHPDWPSSKLKDKILPNNIVGKDINLLRAHEKHHSEKSEVKFIEHVVNNYYKVIRDENLTKESLPIIHFCHISCKESFNFLYKVLNDATYRKEISNRPKDIGHNISFEVTPHHLLLNSDIKLEISSYGKVLPPLRAKKHPEYLLQELVKGNIKYIATDHAPHTLEEKRLPFYQSPSGFPGFETYPLVLLHKVFQNELTLKTFVQTASENPAIRFNLKKKGFIKEGFYADLIIIDKTDEYNINSISFRSKAKFTPFENSNLSNRRTSIQIWKVYLRGNKINIEESLPLGRIIRM
jgi:dihydroorotase